jgi:hypothetical protein
VRARADAARKAYCESHVEELDPAKFRCTLCSKLFAGRHFVENHLARKHGDALADEVARVEDAAAAAAFRVDPERGALVRASAQPRPPPAPRRAASPPSRPYDRESRRARSPPLSAPPRRRSPPPPSFPPVVVVAAGELPASAAAAAAVAAASAGAAAPSPAAAAAPAARGSDSRPLRVYRDYDLTSSGAAAGAKANTSFDWNF